MGDSIPPDPYKALGVPREATAAVIKTAYKKAALRCHPDKAKDKNAAADEFHKVNQAYELLVDPEKRQRYEDSVRLSQLRRDLHEKRGPGSAFGAPPPGHPRASPGDASRPTYSTRSPPSQQGPFQPANGRVYEERRPKYFEEDTRFDSGYFRDEETRASSRKFEGYARSQPPRPTSSRAQESRNGFRTEKVSPKFKRNEEVKKKQEQEQQRARSRKYSQPVSSGSSSSSSSEDEYFRQRSKEEVEREIESLRRRAAASTAGPAPRDETSRKYNNWRAESVEYMERFNTPKGKTPPVDGKYREEVFSQYQEPEPPRGGTPREAKPSPFRRESAKAKDSSFSRPQSSGKGAARRGSQTPEVAPEPSRPSPFTYYSSPPGGEKGQTRKAQTTEDYAQNRPRNPGVKRSETMPIPTKSQAPPPRTERHDSGSTNLRYTDTHDSGYNTSSPSNSPQPEQQQRKQYHYPSSPRQPDLEAGLGSGSEATFNTTFREPSYNTGIPNRKAQSPSPPPTTTRPPIRPRASSNPAKATSTAGHHSKDRSGPPPSRSAAYEAPPQAPPSATPSRRPSTQRANTSQPRAPPLSRGNTAPSSSANASPSMHSQPYPIKTSGFASNAPSPQNYSPNLGAPSGHSPKLFGEIRRERSPEEFGTQSARPGSSSVAGTGGLGINMTAGSGAPRSTKLRDEGLPRRSSETVDRERARERAKKSSDSVAAAHSRSREREREQRDRDRDRDRERMRRSSENVEKVASSRSRERDRDRDVRDRSDRERDVREREPKERVASSRQRTGSVRTSGKESSVRSRGSGKGGGGVFGSFRRAATFA